MLKYLLGIFATAVTRWVFTCSEVIMGCLSRREEVQAQPAPVTIPTQGPSARDGTGPQPVVVPVGLTDGYNSSSTCSAQGAEYRRSWYELAGCCLVNFIWLVYFMRSLVQTASGFGDSVLEVMENATSNTIGYGYMGYRSGMVVVVRTIKVVLPFYDRVISVTVPSSFSARAIWNIISAARDETPVVLVNGARVSILNYGNLLTSAVSTLMLVLTILFSAIAVFRISRVFLMDLSELMIEWTEVDLVTGILDTNTAANVYRFTRLQRRRIQRVPRLAGELSTIARLRHRVEDHADTTENRILIHRFLSDYATAARRENEPGFENIRNIDLNNIVNHAVEMYFIPTMDELERPAIYAVRECKARRRLAARSRPAGL